MFVLLTKAVAVLGSSIWSGLGGEGTVLCSTLSVCGAHDKNFMFVSQMRGGLNGLLRNTQVRGRRATFFNQFVSRCLPKNVQMMA